LPPRIQLLPVLVWVLGQDVFQRNLLLARILHKLCLLLAGLLALEHTEVVSSMRIRETVADDKSLSLGTIGRISLSSAAAVLIAPTVTSEARVE